jgi:GTP-binding protein Era
MVQVINMEEKENIFVIAAQILTNNERYKKMIIGKKGITIKNIGIKARNELELLTNKKIFLDLQVVVDPHWPEKFL